MRSRFVRASRTSVEAMLRQWLAPKAGHCRRIAAALVGEDADETVTSPMQSPFSGTLPARDANPADVGLVVKGLVKERPQLRNALKDKLIPVNSTTPEWGVVQSVMDEPLKKFDQIVIGHQIDLAGINVEIDLDQPDEGVWLEDSKGNVVSCAEVSYSDAQVVDCCFHEPAAPGKYTLVLANRARKKGSDYKLCRHCRAVTVIASPS